jgi:sugar O-acyltransferase (sialic acid O-acetyltransferase NeuD family)
MSSWKRLTPSRTKIIMYGGADQARVNIPILHDLGCEVLAVVDDTLNFSCPFDGVPLLSGFDELCAWMVGKDISDYGFVIAIGNPYGHIRCILDSKMKSLGIESISFADPSSSIRSDVSLAGGLQIMPHAVIHNNVKTNKQCIINTMSLVEHDCVLEQGVEVGPGAVLCGRVHVGENSWVGAGATVRPRVKIGKNSIVGAGATVVKDVPDGVTVVGTPAIILPHSVPKSQIFYNKKS